MSRIQRLAGLKVTRGIHLLRHTFCSRLAMAGAPAKAIQELAGHQNLSTTQRYMRLSPAAIRMPEEQSRRLKIETGWRPCDLQPASMTWSGRQDLNPWTRGALNPRRRTPFAES
jgi:integrase